MGAIACDRLQRATRVVVMACVAAGLLAACNRREGLAPGDAAADAGTSFTRDARTGPDALGDAAGGLDLTPLFPRPEDAGSPPDAFVIPLADPDAGACGTACAVGNSLCLYPVGVVCFGDAPEPYLRYLRAGAPAGRCPSRSDFHFVGGEACWFAGCGPILPAAVPALADGGAAIITGDAGRAECCFWVDQLCGV